MAGEERKPVSSTTVVIIVIIVAGALVVATVAAFWWWLGNIAPRGLIVGSGDLVSEEWDYSDFTGVSVGMAFDVEITQSSSYSINITADDNLFEYVEVSLTGNTLTINLRCCYSYLGTTNRAVIAMPGLNYLDFSGATHGSVEGFSSTDDFVLLLSGASSLSGDYTTTGNAEFDLSGASSLQLEGGAADILIRASGGSQLELSGFPVNNADIDLSGASRATVNLDGRLDAELSGASQLLYLGDPTLGDVNTSGGSTIAEG